MIDKIAKFCAEIADMGCSPDYSEIEKACGNVDEAKWLEMSGSCEIDGNTVKIENCPKCNDANHLQVGYILNINCPDFIN